MGWSSLPTKLMDGWSVIGYKGICIKPLQAMGYEGFNCTTRQRRDVASNSRVELF
jgi:hypothetical protein